jgi:GNAT superfamily N-acetyltransferase
MIVVRPATLEDIETIVGHRRSMFVDMGHTDIAALDAMSAAFRPWLQKKFVEQEYLAWMAVGPDGLVVAGLGLWLMDWLPHMIGPGKPRGNIVNVYTVLAFRRQGIARRLMEAALEWCREHGLRTVILHASENGKPLYEAFGFKPTNEMRLVLEPRR